MTSWRTLKFQGCDCVSRIAAVFEIGPPLPEQFPFASFTVKVLEHASGTFTARPNVAVRKPNGYPDVYRGRGHSPDEALADSLDYLWWSAKEYDASLSHDFIWFDKPRRRK